MIYGPLKVFTKFFCHVTKEARYCLHARNYIRTMLKIVANFWDRQAFQAAAIPCWNDSQTSCLHGSGARTLWCTNTLSGSKWLPCESSQWSRLGENFHFSTGRVLHKLQKKFYCTELYKYASETHNTKQSFILLKKNNSEFK